MAWEGQRHQKAIMKEEEKQYFYIYFAVAITFPQVLQRKIVKAPNIRSFSDYVIPLDHL